jgi:hypothetical protein
LTKTEVALESLVRGRLTACQMESADVECVVRKAKASPSWQAEPP